MSAEERQAIVEQQDKNTIDIRKIKNVIWIMGVLITCGSFIWKLSESSANTKNERENEIKDLKSYISRVKDSIVTVTTVKINGVTVNFNHKLDSVVQQQNDKIEKLPARFRFKVPASYGLQYYYDPTGQRHVTASTLKNN